MEHVEEVLEVEVEVEADNPLLYYHQFYPCHCLPKPYKDQNHNRLIYHC